MATQFVTLTGTFSGIMTTADSPTEPPKPPLGIWGPTDPRPTHPIAGWNPATGGWPNPQPPGIWPGPHPSHPIMLPGMPGWGSGGGGGVQPPLGIWGPTDPRPTHPIAGWDPNTGTWPTPPWQPQPPGSGSGAPPVPAQPIAGQPGPGGQLVFFYSPMYGVVAVPASGSWADFLPQPVAPPVPTEPPPTTGAPEPPVA